MARRMCPDRGASIVEWGAMVLVVGVVVTALVASDLGTVISTRIQWAVCTVFEQESCGDPGDDAGPPVAAEEPAPPAPQGDPQTGPAIGAGGRVVVLPFPGSVTVECSLTQEACGGESGDAGGSSDGTPRVAVEAVVKGSIERSECDLGIAVDPETNEERLRGQVNLSVSTELVVTAKGSAESHNVTVEGSVGTGQRTTYRVTVSEAEAEAIADGDMAPPNPLDPTTIPQYDSVTMTEEDFREAGLSAQYGVIKGELGFEEGERAAGGVTRLGRDAYGRDLVQVYVGDEDYVKNRAMLGIAYNDVGLGIGGSREAADGRARTATIDISTQEGWDAYQSFVRTGELPDADTPGVVDSTRRYGYNSSSSTQIEARAGRVGISLPGRSHDSSLTIEESADGSTVQTYSYRIDNVTHVIEARVAADGRVLSRDYSVALEGVDDSFLEGYTEFVTGSRREFDGDQDVMFRFSEQDLLNMQNSIAAHALERCDDVGCEWLGGEKDPPTTVAEMRERLQRMGSEAYPIPVDLVGNDLGAQIAGADGPGRILQAIGLGGGLFGGSQNDLFQALEVLDLEIEGFNLPYPGIVQPSGC